ncbi:MAG TPA: HD domain-containing phosphohydrolase [Polyangiaceae bacterium]|jgi:HD-GYP domain-containing protein (c-di-GMP phosphodiesterase class II)
MRAPPSIDSVSPNPEDRDAGIRRAEIVAAWSHATDLVIGQPMEYALKSCVLSMRLAAALGLGLAERVETYHHALLRYIGCNAETDAMAALFGDEIAFRRALAPLDTGDPVQLAPVLLRSIMQAQSGQSLPAMIWGALKGLVASKSETAAGFRAHCETAERFGRRLGFDDAIIKNLGQFNERWDGKGMPNGVKGAALAPAVRVVTLAQDVIVLSETQGIDAAVAAVRKRHGKVYEPRIADLFLARPDALTADLDAQSSWDAVLALEPEPHARLSEAQFDEACLALADFADIKSPFTFGHSRGVAELATAAGRLRGLPAPEVTALRRAALLHDIGQVAISSGIFAKPGALSGSDWEKIRLHPYHAERILARPRALARLAQIAAYHHERLDGSGYHRGARGDALSTPAKILAAAEAYQAMTEARPHRPALSADQAATALKREVREGLLDSEAAAAVLEAAGHRVPPVRRELVAGLTARELEVLCLVASGQTMKQIGRSLGISPKTADNHIQNLYGKIGVRTRAGATLFAIEHGLTANLRK